VLAVVVEVASGMRFGDFLKAEIFEPLGMKDTDFWVPAEKMDSFVTAYYRSEGELQPWLGRNLCVGVYDRMPAFQSGGAGLVSTIDDYARFGRMLVNGGELDGVRVLSKRIIQFMTSSQLDARTAPTFNWQKFNGYGYGNFLRVLEHEGQCMQPGSVGEFGWDGWMSTYFAASPKDDMVLVLMQQRIGGGDEARKFSSVAYSAL
jgi:CubicO group peptidase (beta-lactamase class C family)